MTVKNVGSLPVDWEFKNSEVILCTIPWLHFSPCKGHLEVKQVILTSAYLKCWFVSPNISFFYYDFLPSSVVIMLFLLEIKHLHYNEFDMQQL